ncbi:MAG: spore germination protein [bacterium]|nr:spore germination protein [bacterium]
MENLIKRLKKDTNNAIDITYRKKIIDNNDIYIIYNNSLTSDDNISDFVVRSLTYIDRNNKGNINDNIENNISNFNIITVNNYEEICKYLNKGFTIILTKSKYYALETKKNLNRGITSPTTESNIRGAMDSFIENYETNIGLIRKRIQSNDLWIERINVGKYTNTFVGVLSINGVVKKELVNDIIERIKKINIDGIIDTGTLKNLLIKEDKVIFPITVSTERPDVVALNLLKGKVAIVIDNSPFVIIVPALFNDFFKTIDDNYSQSINTTFSRIISFIAFFIALLTPAIYIALTTYNQETIPTELLVNFALQRDGVPFPAFFEAIIMLLSFEILKESDIRVPSFTGSALSIVGALILGEAAVNAGIVSPIMIIVIAITSISSLIFIEADLSKGLRWYRLLFMLGASFMGLIGIVIVFIYFMIKLSDIKSFGIPYLTPFAPFYKEGLKDSIIKVPENNRTKRESYLSNNIIRERNK